MADNIAIPSWEITELDNLSSEGSLSGIDPNVLAVMAQAESGGEARGAGVNSEGYGGYFGLGAGTVYPGGGSVSRATLETNSQASFIQQAQVAAAEFASLMKSNNDSVLAAENAYQGGSTEGSSMMKSELQPSELGSNSNTPVVANGTGSGTGSTGSDVSSNTTSGSAGLTIATIPVLGNVTIPTGMVTRAALGLFGMVLLYLALKEMFSSNDAPTIVTNGVQQGASSVKSKASDVKDAGVAAVMA